MKYETGKFYLNRDGIRCQIFNTNNHQGNMDGAFLFQGKWIDCHWKPTGSYFANGEQHGLDLVGED
jgi:hypothetical protein